MIEIKKCETLQGLEDFGFDLYPTSVIMAAKDKDEILGAGEIIAYDGYAVLGKIFVKEEYQGMMMDHSIAKSLLNMADLGGIRYIFCDMEDSTLARRLLMKENTQSDLLDLPKIVSRYKYFLDLDGYFTTHGC
ncbi:MAG: hypothetical protein IKJ68_03830 [Clostridia bacterium]|nr:hypothetical protein [Clostridia bacterium]